MAELTVPEDVHTLATRLVALDRLTVALARGAMPQEVKVRRAASGAGGSAETATRVAAVAERLVTVPDLFCTFCHSLGIDARKENDTPVGRPIKIVDGGAPVLELF